MNEPLKRPLTPEEKKTMHMVFKKRTRPVLVYLVVLIISIVALLTLSYFMQHRANKQLDDMQSTVTDLQSNYDMIETINDLQGTVASQNEQISTVTDQLKDAQDTIEDLQEQLAAAQSNESTQQNLAVDSSAKVDALSYLLLAEQFYTNGDYDTCQTILNAIGDGGYDEQLYSLVWTCDEAVGKSAYQLYTELVDNVNAALSAELTDNGAEAEATETPADEG